MARGGREAPIGLLLIKVVGWPVFESIYNEELAPSPKLARLARKLGIEHIEHVPSNTSIR